jgi:hypothetical protein
MFQLSHHSLHQGVQNNESSNYLREFNVHGSVNRNNILIYIQQDTTLHREPSMLLVKNSHGKISQTHVGFHAKRIYFPILT